MWRPSVSHRAFVGSPPPPRRRGYRAGHAQRVLLRGGAVGRYRAGRGHARPAPAVPRGAASPLTADQAAAVAVHASPAPSSRWTQDDEHDRPRPST